MYILWGHMQNRLLSNVDVVIESGVMDFSSDIADILSMNDECVDMYLIGRKTDCGYFLIKSTSKTSDGSIGLCMSNLNGSTAPTDKMIDAMSKYPDGILMIINPYACEIGFYKNTEKGLIQAKVLVSE